MRRVKTVCLLLVVVLMIVLCGSWSGSAEPDNRLVLETSDAFLQLYELAVPDDIENAKAHGGYLLLVTDLSSNTARSYDVRYDGLIGRAREDAAAAGIPFEMGTKAELVDKGLLTLGETGLLNQSHGPLLIPTVTAVGEDCMTCSLTVWYCPLGAEFQKGSFRRNQAGGWTAFDLQYAVS